MEIQLNSGEICLAENQPVCLRHGAGREILCTEGIIWITLAGCSEDIFLHTGQRYRVNSEGLTIVESIGDARFRVGHTENTLRWPLVFQGLQQFFCRTKHQAMTAAA